MTHQITIEEANENLLACATFLAENIKSSDGHAEALKEIVPRYLEKDAVDLAAELANTIDDPFTRDRLLMLVAERCAAIDDDEYAFQLVEAIEDYGTQAQAREHLALGKSSKGDFAAALKIAGTLDHADYAYADVAVRQFESGDETNARQTLEKIDYPNAKVGALQSLAQIELKKDKIETAVQLLGEAVKIADEIELVEEKVRTLIDIANHFIEAKQNGLAIETFDKAKAFAELIDGVHRDFLLASVALGFLQAGTLELADRTLDLVTDKTQMASALVGFSRSFWGKNEADEALETLEEAYAILKSQRDNEIRDSRARFGIWRAVATEFARIGKVERAIEIAQEIIDENEQIHALRQIAQTCAAEGKDDLARQALSAIQEDAQRMFGLIGISDAVNESGKTVEALNFLNEARSLSETVPQLASRSAALNELARRYKNYGETERARELFRENLETIAAIRDESSRAVTLAQLNDFYEQSKFDLTDAEKEILQTLVRKAES